MNEVEINHWADFMSLAGGPDFKSWAFRGQADAHWQILSTLSRTLIDANINLDAWEAQEQRTLRIFQRKAHLFLRDVPPHDDAFHWLSIMQHHGAPTRLVDFTWSPFVAAFFALERATREAAVFAICPPKVLESYDRLVPAVDEHTRATYDFRGANNYAKYFRPNKYEIVYHGEPYVLNQRLIAQGGTFFVPGVLHKSLEDIVSDLPACDGAMTKFILKTRNIRRDAMSALYSMNITNATLFPGLDGMARSIAYELESHWAYDPVTLDAVPGFETLGLEAMKARGVSR